MNDIVEQVIKGLDCYEQLDLALGFNEAFERVAEEQIAERRWGPQILYVVKHKETGTLIGIEVYSMKYNEYGESEVENVYEVVPVEVTVTTYNRV